MVSLVALLTWRLPAWLVLPIFLIFASLDGVYVSSALFKVPQGAWFTLMLAVVLSSIFILWRFGKEAQWTAESLDRLPASALLTATTDGGGGNDQPPVRLADAFGGTPVSTVPGLGIFFDKQGDPAVLPASFAHFVRKFAARPRVLVFFHMRPLPVPTVAPGERFVVTRAASAAAGLLPDCYSVVMRHGYTDDVLRPGMARELVAQVELAVARQVGSGSSRGNGGNEAALAALREAYGAQTVYVLGKETMRIGRPAGKSRYGPGALARRFFLAMFLWLRENSRTKLADLDIDVDKLVEVGFLKEI
jgi:KUP system potassium uptake protein